MKFVALISGGKDSCFNILHCLHQGHELVALANLYPPESETQGDEMDSWMYQTVGFHAIEKYGDALGVPLYRVPIKRKSTMTSLQYEITEDDETEDLRILLELVKQAHPEVQAVSSGAILSSYQRIRVEHVCTRLGLVSLAFLWQRSQAELLDEIIDSGLDARVIKTAGAGLARIHLGKSLVQLRPLLHKLNLDFGLHLCGEGGEYETLVFDGPIFQKRLNITDSSIVDHSSDDVSYLTLKVELEDKTALDVDYHSLVKEPPILSEEFQEIFNKAQKKSTDSSEILDISHDFSRFAIELKIGEKLKSSNPGLNIVPLSGDDSLEEQAKSVFEQLEKQIPLDSIAYISLLLSNMNDFSAINNVYGAFFKSVNPPPARACIQVNGMTSRLKLSAYPIEKYINERNGLHVQSQSYWAPANIGPYSQQMNNNAGICYLAGQIGLIPATMQLASQTNNSRLFEATLALQNISRVMLATNCNMFAAVVSFVASQEMVSEVRSVWHSTPGPKPRGLLIAHVPQLPRQALVEWTGLGIDHVYWQREAYEDDDDTVSWPSRYEQEHQGQYRLVRTNFGHYQALTLMGSIEWVIATIEHKTIQSPVYCALYINGISDGSDGSAGALCFSDVVHTDGLFDETGTPYQSGAVLIIRN